MLVVTRGQGQSVDIGPNIRVTVISIIGNKVQLGIEAPESVPIFRSEIATAELLSGGKRKDGDSDP